MKRLGLCVLAWAVFGSSAAVGQAPARAVVAIASGPKLSLYDEAGNVVRRIDLKSPVAGFAFSPDRSKLVIVSPNTEHGGKLFLIDPKGGSRRNLTPWSHFAFRHLDKGEREVYDSPAFSPDGKGLLFAVHGNVPGDGNDAWENSGPLAILDLKTGRPRVLQATNNIDGNGPCSEGDAQWSPDGKWILFNCEDGALLVDPRGAMLQNLKIDQNDTSSSSVGWVGSNCILYVQTPMKGDDFDFDHETVKLLNLTTQRSSDAGELVKGFSGLTRGLLRVSGDAVIREIWPNLKLIIETKQKQWNFQFKQEGQAPQTVSAQLLTGWDPLSIPDECK